MDTPKKTRTRLPPAERIAEILDHTANMVATEGVAAVSVEKIGKAAGISKSLVYSYFANTTELLQALLERELTELRRKQNKAMKRSRTFEQMVRGITHEYLLHIEKRGLIIYRLQSEPSVAEGTSDFTTYGRVSAVKALAEITNQTFGIPMSIAIPATDISFGLPDAAGHYLDNEGADRQLVEDITVAMIIASVKALKDNYEVSFKEI